MLETSQEIFLDGVSSVLNPSVLTNNAYLTCFKCFNSKASLMGHLWNKHLTKATIVCVPIDAAGVILNAIFDWLVVGVILWASWEFLHHRFQKRIGIFK